MRRILILAAIAVVATAFVAPRLKTASRVIPALHSVSGLMTCDAGAIAQISTAPGSTGSGSCADSAAALGAVPGR